jgi:hypothetical protein
VIFAIIHRIGFGRLPENTDRVAALSRTGGTARQVSARRTLLTVVREVQRRQSGAVWAMPSATVTSSPARSVPVRMGPV